MYNTFNSQLRRMKRQLGILFPLLWHAINLFTWIVFYLLFEYFSSYNNEIGIVISTLFCIVIYSLLLEVLVDKVIKIFPFWMLVISIGIIVGILYSLVFLIIEFLFVILGNYLVFSNLMTLDFTTKVFLSSLASLIGAGLGFTLPTYGLYFQIIKPVLNSDKTSQKTKIILTGIIVYGFSMFITLTIVFIALSTLRQNFLLSTLVGAITFSLTTNSGFNEIFTENSIFHAFKSQN